MLESFHLPSLCPFDLAIVQRGPELTLYPEAMSAQLMAELEIRVLELSDLPYIQLVLGCRGMDNIKIFSREKVAHERLKILPFGIVECPRVRVATVTAIFRQDNITGLAGLPFEVAVLPYLFLAVGAFSYELSAAPASGGGFLPKPGLRVIGRSEMSPLASDQGLICYCVTFRTVQYYR